MAINLVQGDTAPQLKLVLTDDITLQPINLTGASVTLHVRPAGSSVLAFSRPATVLSSADAALGIAYIQWEPTDLERAPGSYDSEIEIITQAGLRETVYDFVQLFIREDIA